MALREEILLMDKSRCRRLVVGKGFVRDCMLL